MSLRSKLSALAIVLSLAMPTLASAADLKVGYVNLARVLSEVEEAKAARARLQKWVESREKEIAQEQQTLLKEKETLEKQASAMSQDVREQKAADFQKKYVELMKKFEASQREVAEREGKEMGPIRKKLEETIATIAQRGELDMVFERQDSGLLFAAEQYDLTNEVIRTFNSTKSSKPKDAPVAKDAPKK
jgi:outer membrane protein